MIDLATKFINQNYELYLLCRQFIDTHKLADVNDIRINVGETDAYDLLTKMTELVGVYNAAEINPDPLQWDGTDLKWKVRKYT